MIKHADGAAIDLELNYLQEIREECFEPQPHELEQLNENRNSSAKKDNAIEGQKDFKRSGSKEIQRYLYDHSPI